MGGAWKGLWLKVRVTVYIAVAAGVLLARTVGCSRRTGVPALGVAGSRGDLVIAGNELAPGLIEGLAASYRRDYPDLGVRFLGGGTARALEELANRRADAAFLSRPPSPEEQRLIRTAGGDTLPWFPVALGGLVLLRQPAGGEAARTVAELRGWLGSDEAPRLYAPDPNSGVWGAFTAGLAVPDSGAVRVTYLAGDSAVVAAVRADAGALGLVSGFADCEATGLDSLALRAAPDSAAARPTPAAVAAGAYPLYHYLFVACRAHDSIRGTMFVTHLTSDRGQRQVERAGWLPARHPMREIALTTHPLGKTAK